MREGLNQRHETYVNDGFLALQADLKGLFLNHDVKITTACSFRDGNRHVNVLKGLFPPVTEYWVFSLHMHNGVLQRKRCDLNVLIRQGGLLGLFSLPLDTIVLLALLGSQIVVIWFVGRHWVLGFRIEERCCFLSSPKLLTWRKLTSFFSLTRVPWRLPRNKTASFAQRKPPWNSSMTWIIHFMLPRASSATPQSPQLPNQLNLTLTSLQALPARSVRSSLLIRFTDYTAWWYPFSFRSPSFLPLFETSRNSFLDLQ